MIKTRLKKDGTVAFYNGRKLATTEEAKRYIKESYKTRDMPTVDTSKLSPELRKYAGAVKGGVSRSNSSLIDKKGHFIKKDFQKKVLKNMKIDIEALKKAKNVGSLRELFKDDNLKKRFDKVILTGVEAWFNSHSAIDKLQEFDGTEIYINRTLTSKPNATKKLSDVVKTCRRHFDAVDTIVRFVFRELEHLYINLPTKDDILEYPDDDVSSFNEDWGSDVYVYVSDKKTQKEMKEVKKANRKKKKING